MLKKLKTEMVFITYINQLTNKKFINSQKLILYYNLIKDHLNIL